MKKTNVTISLIIVILIAMFVAQPQENISATLSGILLWANTLLPALFPFFFFTRLLTQFGLIEHICRYLEPITKKLFKTPGISAYVYLMSILSGYPVGAKLTADLYNDNIISQQDAVKITTFTSTSGPLFVVGSVGVGMFLDAKIGVIVLISHLIGAIFNGILYRNYNFGNKTVSQKNTDNYSKFKSLSVQNGSILEQKILNKNNDGLEKEYKIKSLKTLALQTHYGNSAPAIDLNNQTNINLLKQKTTDQNKKKHKKRTIQKESTILVKIDDNILEKTMYGSIKSILIVGGYVSLFFLIITMLNSYHILTPINIFLSKLLTTFKIPSQVASPLVNGIIEITKGCLDLSKTGVGKLTASVFATAIITFGGFSTHMQALTFLRSFKIKISFFLAQKLTHTIISVLICVLIGLVIF